MTARVLVFNVSGTQRAEIEAELQEVVWRLGQTGRARLAVAYSNPHATPGNLRSGNRLLIQFDNGLPDWGGVVDFPLSRRSDGIVATAYEGEHLLSWRVTERTRKFTDTVPGTIAQTLLETANADEVTGILAGTIYTGGTAQSREYHYAELLASLRDLALEAGHDYVVIPMYAARQMDFDLHWYERRGVDRRDTVLLAEGHNVGAVMMDEQGPLYNRIIAVGSGQTWAERPVSIQNDTDSQLSYGLRELPTMHLDITSQTTLDAIAAALLAEYSEPRIRATLVDVTDTEPCGFEDYDVGDIVTLHAFLARGDWAYDGPVRLLARQWHPDGRCTLEVEEWRD